MSGEFKRTTSDAEHTKYSAASRAAAALLLTAALTGGCTSNGEAKNVSHEDSTTKHEDSLTLSDVDVLYRYINVNGDKKPAVVLQANGGPQVTEFCALIGAAEGRVVVDDAPNSVNTLRGSIGFIAGDEMCNYSQDLAEDDLSQTDERSLKASYLSMTQ